MTKTALITGASRGLGRVIATFLAGNGYDLVLTARGAEALEATAETVVHHGHRVVAIAGDVTDPVHRRALADAVGDHLDVLVNNASALGPSPMPQLNGYPLEELRAVFEANVIAPVALVQELGEALRGGLVVNVTSDAAVGAYEGWGGYGASKAALELVSRTQSAELSDVTVVTVDPGDLRTQMHQDAFPGQDISDRPTPEVTIPFWAWLFSADHAAVDGRRFQAQGERWEVAS